MCHDRPILHDTSSAKSISLPETLSDAVIFLNETEIIPSASTQAATVLGVSKHELAGTTLWPHISHLITTPFYQMLNTATHTDEPFEMEEALRQSQKLVQSLMHSNIIGLFCAEGDEIREADETFLCMTGYSREDLRLRRLNWFHMTAPEYLDITRLVQQQLSLYEHITPYEKEYICKDGSRLPVVVSGVLTKRDSFQTICFVLDNSARKAWEHRKDDFLSIASHELRTPLTSLKLQTQMLSKQRTRQNVSRADIALSRMEGQLNTVIRLVEELLDLSNIQAGKLEYIQETVKRKPYVPSLMRP